MNSAERGAGAGDGAWEKLAGCREAGAATGIGGANGRAEDCPEVDGALGEDVRTPFWVEGQACSELDWAL